MTSELVVVNLTRGRLAVYQAGRRVWLGTQDQWAEARKVCAEWSVAEVVQWTSGAAS